MAEQYTPNLGQTPAADARRDAVHIAVAPVVAGDILDPCSHVWLDGDGVAFFFGLPEGSRRLGIVDPFRDSRVMKGELFWLCLYPGTITGLRHVWSHPAFLPARRQEDNRAS